MQSFADFTLFEDYLEALVNGFRSSPRENHIPLPMYAMDSKYIRKSTEEHLLHFSNQIVIVEDIKMAQIKEGLVPSKLNQWLKRATDLKCQVSDALKKQQSNKDLAYTELKEMCDKIFENMKDCPVDDVNDKPMAFIAQMHETEDGNMSNFILLPSEDDVQVQDVEKEVASSDKEGNHTKTIRSKSGIISFLESYYGAPQILSREGESSQVHDAPILEISPKDSSYQYISSDLQDEHELKTTEESYASKGMPIRSASKLAILRDVLLRRDGKMPIGETDFYEKSTSSTDIELQPKLKDLTSENNPAQQKELGSPYSLDSEHHNIFELSMMIRILLNGEMSKYMDLGLQILISKSPTQATFNMNNDFGLHRKTDSYLFFVTKKPDSQRTLTVNSASLLPGDLIVNKSGSGSQEMLTYEEWHRAGVVNLIEKKVCVLNEEPHCPNLVILFLQRNSRLTDICSSFFNQMPALRFLDLSDTRIKALPSSLFELINLQVLLLRGCVCLDNLPPEIRNLINMEVLDLLGTELSYFPKEISELTKLRHLQLSFHQPYSLVQSSAIFKLQALQGLSIVVHPEDQHWKSIVGDVIKQVAKLKMLRYLQFYFPTVEALNIKRIISRVPDEVEYKYEQYDRCLRFVNGNGNEVPEIMKSILERVTAFYLDCHLDVVSLSDFDISIFKELKFCVLRECPNIHLMIKREKKTESYFPNLEYLGLHYLWKLEQIWEDPIPTGSYQALKYLMVSTCGKLEFIASHAVLQCLYNLETFIIEDCESLKSIVKENEMEKYDNPLLPRLKELVLRHLPQLVVLGRGLFPSEEILSIHFCPELVLGPGPNRIEWKKLLRLPYMNVATSTYHFCPNMKSEELLKTVKLQVFYRS